MFQLLKNPNYDFMGKRNVLLGVSLVLVAASVVVIAVHGLNMGIEFTGGAELQVKFADTPDITAIRATVQDAGVGSARVTEIGDPEEHEVYIRIGIADDAEQQSDPIAEIVASLRARFGESRGDLVDLNVADSGGVESLLRTNSEVTAEQAEQLAAAILELRKETAIFHSHDEFAGIDGMTPEILENLRQATFVGPFSVRSQSFIGPAIGKELLQKAKLAIVGALAFMMVYIWIRFQIEWGFAAVIALTHDTLITLGLFSIFGKEMSLPVVAAFLTLVGYSVNDTVVVFDRIRENLRKKQTSRLEDVINLSINQTLSRTIITSGLTWIVVFGLFLFGGTALNPFAFVLSVGVIVGTYSSIYIAAPILVLWRQFVSRRDRGTGAAKVSTAS